MLDMNVEDIMTEHVVTIDKSASVRQAAHILLRFRINGLLITEGEDKKTVIGVITTTDLLKLFDMALEQPTNKLAELSKISEDSVLNGGSPDVLKVQKGTKVKKLIAIMHRKNIHTIPVFEGEELIGVVGRHDILNVAFQKED
jgi:CBS domain-containing protein